MENVNVAKVELTKEQEIELKFNKIRKASHWFKMIGGTFFFVGWLTLFVIVLMTILGLLDGKFDFSVFFSDVLNVGVNLVLGWCFIMLSDCMNAIDYLFVETKDIV